MKTNQSQLKRTLRILSFVFLLVISACSKDENDSKIIDDDDPPVGTNLTFDAVIGQGGEFEEIPQSRIEETLEEGEEYPEDYTTETGSETATNRFICKSRTVSVTDGTGEFQTLGGVATEIYPGALLQGNTINNVKPQAIPLKRAGGSISYNLNDGNLKASQDLDEMSESQVRQAMNNIISGSSGVVPSNFVLTYENVFSEEQLALEMGLSYEGYGVKAEGKLSFSTENTYNRVLVKLNQSYYDISYDFPTSYDDVFDESVAAEDLDKYIQADNPATYIKKVTYGRIFYMLIESTSSLEEMNTQISASYDGFNNDIEGNLEVDTMKKMENLKVKVIAYGGDSQNTFASLGETNVEALANMLAASTDIRTGLPLSYEIYSLEDPSKQVGVNISTEMEVVECELKGVLPPQGYSKLVGLFEDGIGAATAVAGSNAILFNGAGTEYVWFNGNTGAISKIFSIKDSNAPLGAIRYNAIDAGVLYIPGEIWLYDKESLEFVIFKFDPGPYAGNSNTIPNSYIGTKYYGPFNTNEVHNANLGTGESFPFASVGFGAAAYLGYTKTTEQETYFGGIIVHNIYKYRHIYIERGLGNTYAYEDYIVDRWTKIPFIGSQTTGTDITRKWTEKRDFRDYDKSTWALDAVGAGCKVTLGNGDLKLLYFGTDGKTFFIRNDLYGAADGPYVID